MAEKMALAYSWIDVSEDTTTGNAQVANHFLMLVREPFHQELGRKWYRSTESLNIKYREVNCVVMKFNRLIHNLRIQWKNRQTEQNVFEEMLKIYKSDNKGTSFKYVEFWRIVENRKKWKDLKESDIAARQEKYRKRLKQATQHHQTLVST